MSPWSTTYPRAIKHNVPAGRLYQLNLCQTRCAGGADAAERPEAVIHFAAFIAVGESMRDPGRYFSNNVCGSLSLLNAMVQTGVKHMVFSSTAAVYGTPETVPDSGDLPDPAGKPVWRIEGHGGDDAPLVRRNPPSDQRVPALLQCLRRRSRGHVSAKSTSPRRT